MELRVFPEPLDGDKFKSLREDFLYKRDARYVLSADTHIWPEAESVSATQDAVLPVQVRFCILHDSPCSLTSPFRFSEFPLNAEIYELLGFDVTDCWGISGLCNCGLSAQERSLLTEEFSERLNEFHLFTDSQSASTFAKKLDSLIPEHAPFYTVAVFIYESDLARITKSSHGL